MRSSMFEYMNIFVQVVEQGGFARAADVLGVVSENGKNRTLRPVWLAG